MTENDHSGHGSEKQLPVDDNAENKNQSSENKSDIIELSDIAIGISREDDMIVELTEQVIDKAFNGFSGATGEVLQDDERILDLSESESNMDLSEDGAYPTHVSEGADADIVPDDDMEPADDDMEVDNLEDDISKELDNYFGAEENTPIIEETIEIDTPGQADKTEPRPVKDEKKFQIDTISISTNQLDDAVERIIRKMFAEKINRILDEMIERTVSEEISQLKDYLLGVYPKNNGRT